MASSSANFTVCAARRRQRSTLPLSISPHWSCSGANNNHDTRPLHLISEPVAKPYLLSVHGDSSLSWEFYYTSATHTYLDLSTVSKPVCEVPHFPRVPWRRLIILVLESAAIVLSQAMLRSSVERSSIHSEYQSECMDANGADPVSPRTGVGTDMQYGSEGRTSMRRGEMDTLETESRRSIRIRRRRQT
jgi:hypothetical protein